MKIYTSLLMAAFAMVVFAQSSAAFIDPKAPSASHDMEDLAAEIHAYLHDFYPSSYEAHGLEEEAAALHGDLHDWQPGDPDEILIVMDMEALEDAWKTFKQTIHQAHVLNSGDDELDDLFNDVKEAYQHLRFLLRKAK